MVQSVQHHLQLPKMLLPPLIPTPPIIHASADLSNVMMSLFSKIGGGGEAEHFGEEGSPH